MKIYIKPYIKVIDIKHESTLCGSIEINDEKTEDFFGNNRSNLNSDYNNEIW